jgi:hypothetical protein
MPDTKYEAELRVTYMVEENGNQWNEKVSTLVQSFAVDGGANRTIDLGSTNDMSISSEFEQARTHKNVTVFIPPAKDFSAAILTRLGTQIKHFEMTFVVCKSFKGKKIETIWLMSSDTWFLRVPTPVGDTRPLLKADVRFHKADLLHGQFDRKRAKLVYKEI